MKSDWRGKEYRLNTFIQKINPELTVMYDDGYFSIIDSEDHETLVLRRVGIVEMPLGELKTEIRKIVEGYA